MNPGRQFRLVTVIFSLCMMLFAQGALAGYFCPGADALAQGAAVADTAVGATECAAGMHASQPQDGGLCHAHCQSGSQTADTFSPPAPPDAGALTGALTVRLFDREAVGSGGPPPTLLRRSSAPSIALRHCCLRI